MKNKNIVLGFCLLTAVAFACLALNGCKTETTTVTNADGTMSTNTTKVLDTARVTVAANEAASVGTTEVLTAHPEWRPQFQLADDQLVALSKSPNIGLQDIVNIAQQMPVKELHSQTARMSFEGATIAISLLGIPSLPPATTADLQAIAKAISDGITTGIENSPLPPPTPAPAK